MIDAVKSLGDVSNEEKAEILSSLTSQPIPLQSLENLLADEGLAWRNEVSGSWEGPLVDAISSVPVPEVSEGLKELFRHINKVRSVHIESNLPAWAVKCSRLLGALVALGVISVDQRRKVLALGGGLVHGVVSGDDIVLAEQEEASRLLNKQRLVEIEALLVEIQNNFINPARSSSESVEDLRVRIKEGL